MFRLQFLDFEPCEGSFKKLAQKTKVAGISSTLIVIHYDHPGVQRGLPHNNSEGILETYRHNQRWWTVVYKFC